MTKKDSKAKAIIRRKLDSYFEGKLSDINNKIDKASYDIKALTELISQNTQDTSQIIDLLKAERDGLPQLKSKLEEVRKTKAYSSIFKTKKPLITVRIATYNRAKILIERTIPSILNQTYQNFEIIIVGDHCTDDTEARITSLNDKRIRFYNFPQRNVYPKDPQFRWMVAGSPGMNMGANLARGDWIAPLDDDDEFSNDHLEKLLSLVLSENAEMAIGALIQKNITTGTEHRVWSFPPELDRFSFQGAIYMKMLNFFQYDENSWQMREPGDWNLCRRMLQAGVKMVTTEDVVGTMYMVPVDKKPSS